MTKMEEAISTAAREMSREARVELCHLLMHDLDDAEQKAIDDAWAQEINRRIAAIKKGEVTSKPVEEAVERLLRKHSA